jgi:predicted homoserine dehydrogenase-like protein
MTSRPEAVPNSGEPVVAAVFGAGMFGTAVVTQSARVPGISVRVVADAEPGSARHAFRLAGIPDDRIADCEGRRAALAALEATCASR